MSNRRESGSKRMFRLLYFVPLACIFGFSLTLSAQEESEELKNLFHEMSQYKAELIQLINDEQTSDADRITYRERLDNVNLQLARIRTELGIDVVSSPGGTVTATDNSSGKSATKNMQSNCGAHGQYQPPGWSAYKLPATDRVSGKQRRIIEAMIDTEKQLIRILVLCQETWTTESALSWDQEKNRLVDTLLQLESDLADTFAGPFTPAELNQLERAGNYATVRKLKKDAEDAFSHYLEMKKIADAIRAKFGPIPDPSALLNAQKAMQMEKDAWDAFGKADLAYKTAKIKQVDEIRQIEETRINRGPVNLMQLHPGTSFSFHSKRDFVDFSSPIFKNLLGPEGLEIFQAEQQRRYKVTKRPSD